jgi:Tol biopolymer transport system component
MPLPGPENSSSYDPGPCWSPDGRAVCFAGQRNLYVIPLSGGKARKITKDDKGDFDPSWSPDGRHIYFSSYRGNKLGAWRVGVDGGIPEAVTPGTGQEEHPSLSRDGTRLVLAGNITSRELRLIDLGSTKWRPLPVDGEMAVLAPDRSKIAYVWASPGSIGNLWILPLVTASPAPYHLSDDTSDASVPAFSPDGKFIAYSRNKPSPFDIWITPTSGGRAVRFTEHSSRNIHPSWSPDGDSIAFSSDRSGKAQIWIAPVKAGRPTGKARMLASGCAAYGPAWSPDGSRIAFLGVQDDQNELWLAAADGSVPAYQVTTGAAVSQARWVWRTDELVVSGKWGRSSASLRRVNPETGAAQPFRPPMDFGEHEEHGQFDISRDGTLLLALYKSTQGEIWVLQAKKRAF